MTTFIPSFYELDQIVRHAPLGMRCLDMVTLQPIHTGLSVTARHVSGSGSVHQGVRSRLSAVFSFSSLPGVLDYEWDRRPASDFVPAPSNDAPQNYVIAIEDRSGQFLPQNFVVTLPRQQLMVVPLFPSPARALPTGFGAVRAALWNTDEDQPAAWALVTATTTTGSSYFAMADARGVITLAVRYPEPQASTQSGAASLLDLTWSLTFTLNYQPGRHENLPALPPDAPPSRDSLIAQDAALFAGSQPTLVEVLTYRKDLILRSPNESKSRLLVKPAPPP